jgi:hypothetical protein
MGILSVCTLSLCREFLACDWLCGGCLSECASCAWRCFTCATCRVVASYQRVSLLSELFECLIYYCTVPKLLLKACAPRWWTLPLFLTQSKRETHSTTPGARATSVCSLKLLVYAALTYWCMRPSATGVCSLKLLVYEACY